MANLIGTTDHHQHLPKKRKRGESRVFRLKTFGETGHPAEMNELSFRDNLGKLLEFGHFESSGLMGSWSFQLEVNRHPNPLYVLLFVVEEPIEASLNLRCNHCQYVGDVLSLFPSLFVYTFFYPYVSMHAHYRLKLV